MEELEDWTKEFEAECNTCGKTFMLVDEKKHCNENGCHDGTYHWLPKYPVKPYYPLFVYTDERFF